MKPSRASAKNAAATKTQKAAQYLPSTMSEIASGTSSNRPSEIKFGRYLRPSPIIMVAGMQNQAFPRPSLVHTRRARELDPPDRIAAAEIEVDLGQAGFQLIRSADILDLNSRFLATERQQVDFPDRADRSEPATHLHPFSETADGNGDCKTRRLVGMRAGIPVGAALDIRGG